MALMVQRFLQDGGTLEQLETTYAIKAKRHPKFSNLVMLKYNQIESPFRERFVQECRGLILNEQMDWDVIARPFDKFFNIEEGFAATIDWATARVLEKLDGSLMILYYYDGWQVASSGTPDAGGEINGLGITFKELFWKTWTTMSLPLGAATIDRLRDYTLLFELTAPHNRIVVQYNEPKLTLIGVRHKSGFELDPRVFVGTFPVVKSFPLGDLTSITQSLPGMDPLKQEGYVVVDSKHHRVKIKSPRYVAIHHAIDGMGPKRALEIIRNNEGSEVLAYFPEWQGKIEDIRSRLENLISTVETQYEMIKDIENQKDFAQRAIRSQVPDALFSLRSGKTPSVREYFAKSMRLEKLAELLNLADGTFQTA